MINETRERLLAVQRELNSIRFEIERTSQYTNTVKHHLILALCQNMEVLTSLWDGWGLDGETRIWTSDLRT
jgi:hypothetical protein